MSVVDALVGVPEADAVADLVLEDARDVRHRPESLECGVVVDDDEAVCVKGLKIVPLITWVAAEAQPPPMARMPSRKLVQRIPERDQPDTQIAGVQYGSSPGTSWIGTFRVPPKASTMDAVGGSGPRKEGRAQLVVGVGAGPSRA